MSKWIEVDLIDKSDKAFISTAHISYVGIGLNGETLIIFGVGDEYDYIKVSNSYDEIKEMILND